MGHRQERALRCLAKAGACSKRLNCSEPPAGDGGVRVPAGRSRASRLCAGGYSLERLGNVGCVATLFFMVCF